jgi:membrane associated rhomboid family serine protease
MFYILAPTSTDVLFPRFPRCNFALLVLIFGTFVGLHTEAVELESLLLDGWSVPGLFTHMVAHEGFWHLLGNMIFLWVFGNAICTKLPDWGYALLYLGGGLAAAAVHNLTVGGLAIGASGAINAVVGFYLVVYPLNRITFGYFLLWLLPPIMRHGTFRVPGIVVISFWFIKDIWGAVAGGGMVAYCAHLGGFVFGLVAGLVVVGAGGIEMTKTDLRTLVDLFKGKQKQSVRSRSQAVAGSKRVYEVRVD